MNNKKKFVLIFIISLRINPLAYNDTPFDDAVLDDSLYYADDILDPQQQISTNHNQAKGLSSNSFKQKLQNHSGISFLNENFADQTMSTEVIISFFTYRSSPDLIFKAIQKASRIQFFQRDDQGNWNQIDELPSRDEKDIFVIKNLQSYLNELNTVQEELVWVFYHVPGDFQNSFKKTILNGEEVFFQKHGDEDWVEIHQLPLNSQRIPDSDDESTLSLYFYKNEDNKHLFRETIEKEGKIDYFQKTQNSNWENISSIPQDCLIAPGKINERLFQTLNWTYFGDLGMGKWKFKKAEFNHHMIFFMRHKGFWVQIQDPQHHIYDSMHDTEWEYYIHHVSFDLVFRKGNYQGKQRIYQKIEGNKWVQIEQLPEDAVLLRNGDLGGFDTEIQWSYFSLPGINQPLYKSGLYKGQPIYFQKNSHGKWEILDQLPTDVIPFEKNTIFWKFFVVPGEYDSIYKKGIVEGKMYIYLIKKGEEPVQIDQLPHNADEISIQNLEKEIEKTQQVYFFGIIGLNEPLFKRVYVDNHWIDFRRLTLGGWEELLTLPNIAEEYREGKIPQQIHWEYQNLPGDFSTIFRRANIKEQYNYLKKDISGQWEYLPQIPDGTTNATQSGIHDQLQLTKWEYFSDPGENFKKYRRTKTPDGRYIYMQVNDYGDWELINHLPEQTVPYNHDSSIWNYCIVDSKPEFIFKRGEIDQIDHFFSKHLISPWEFIDNLPDECQDISHSRLMKIFPKFVDWTFYGVISIDYKFYKAGKWNGQNIYYKKKLDGDFVKIEELPQLCSLFDSHDPSDEIDWQYFQDDRSDDYLIKKTETPEGSVVAFKVNLFGDMEHIETLHENTQEISPELFDDFVNGDGWKYFGLPGLNKKLFRKINHKDEGEVIEMKDRFGNWIRIDLLPDNVVPYIHKHYDTQYQYIKGDFGVIYKRQKKNGHWIYYQSNDQRNWEEIDKFPNKSLKFQNKDGYYNFLGNYMKSEMYYYTVPGVKEKLYRRFYWEGEWIDQRRDIEGNWEVIDKLPSALIPYKPEMVWPRVKEHFFVHPDNDTMIFKKIFDGYEEAYFKMNLKGFWTQIQQIPDDVEELSEERLHQLIMSFIPWTFYGINGINEKLYRQGIWADQPVTQKLNENEKWEEIDELPPFTVKWVEFDVQWIYFLEPGNPNSIFRKGLQFDGKWKHQQKDKQDLEWQNLKKLPEENLVQVDEKEISDLLQTEVKWIPFTLPHLNHPVYRKGIYGPHSIYMNIKQDGSQEPIDQLPENAIPYYLTEFQLIPGNHEDVFYKKQKQNQWHYYQRSILHDGEEEIQNFPFDSFPVLFEEVPTLLPYELNWEYYGIEGENEKLYRQADWGKYTIFEGITNSDNWKKISELPSNAVLYIYPKYFKYGINPNDLSKFYIEEIQRKKYKFYQVENESDIVDIKNLPENLVFFTKSEIAEILNSRVQWMFYTYKGEHKSEFKATTLAGKQIFMQDLSQDDDSTAIDPWVLIDKLPQNTIPYQHYINWEYCFSTHDLTMVFKTGLFYDEKINYMMTKADKQWVQIKNFPTCSNITKQTAEDLLENGPQWEYYSYPQEKIPEGKKAKIGEHFVYQMKDEDGNWVSVDNLPESFIPTQTSEHLQLEWSYCLLPGKIAPLFIRSTYKNNVLYKVLDEQTWKIVQKKQYPKKCLDVQEAFDQLNQPLLWDYYSLDGENKRSFRKYQLGDKLIYEKKTPQGIWVMIDHLPQEAVPYKLVLPEDLKWEYYIEQEDKHNLYRKVWFFDRFTLQKKSTGHWDWEFIQQIPPQAIQLTPEVVSHLLIPELEWKYFQISHRTDMIFKRSYYDNQEIIFEKHQHSHWAQINQLPEDCEELNLKETQNEELYYTPGQLGRKYKRISTKNGEDHYFVLDEGEWENINDIPQNAESMSFMAMIDKPQWIYYQDPETHEPIFRKAYFDYNWYFFKRINHEWYQMPEVLFNVSNKFNYCEDYLNVSFSYFKPQGENIYYKKGYYKDAWVQLGQDENGNWEHISEIPSNAELFKDFVLDICMPNQEKIDWKYFLNIDQRQQKYRVGRYGDHVVYQYFNGQKWVQVSKIPRKMIQLEENEDYFINWIFYITKDHKWLLKKGTYNGYWIYFRKKVNGHLWHEIESFPEKFDQLTEGELRDYLEGKVHWIYLSMEEDPHKVYYKFGEIDGKMKFYKKQENGHWHQINKNDIDDSSMIFIPPTIDLEKLEWDYYFVEGNTQQLFRKAKYENHDVFFSKEGDDKWRQISSLPENAHIFHIKNTPFEEILKKRAAWKWTFLKDPSDADWIYKKGIKDGKMIYLKKRVGNLWKKVHHLEIPQNLEEISQKEKHLDWLYYILEDDSSVVFRKGLIDNQWHFYSKRTDGGNWEQINYIPDQAILVNKPESPEDQVVPIFWVYYVQLGMSKRLFRISKQKGIDVIQERQEQAKTWTNIQNLPAHCVQITQDAYFYSRIQYNWKYYINPNFERSVIKTTRDEGQELIFEQNHDQNKPIQLEDLPENSILINETKNNFTVDLVWRHYVDPRDVNIEYKIAVVNQNHHHFIKTFNTWKEIKQIPFTCMSLQEWNRIQQNENQENNKYKNVQWKYKRIKSQSDWLYRSANSESGHIYESKYQNNAWRKIKHSIDSWVEIPEQNTPSYNPYWIYQKKENSNIWNYRKRKINEHWENQQYQDGFWKDIDQIDAQNLLTNYSQIPRDHLIDYNQEYDEDDSKYDEIKINGYKEFRNPESPEFRFARIKMPNNFEEYVYLHSSFKEDDKDSQMVQSDTQISQMYSKQYSHSKQNNLEEQQMNQNSNQHQLTHQDEEEDYFDDLYDLNLNYLPSDEDQEPTTADRNYDLQINSTEDQNLTQNDSYPDMTIDYIQSEEDDFPDMSIDHTVGNNNQNTLSNTDFPDMSIDHTVGNSSNYNTPSGTNFPDQTIDHKSGMSSAGSGLDNDLFGQDNKYLDPNFDGFRRLRTSHRNQQYEVSHFTGKNKPMNRRRKLFGKRKYMRGK